MIIEILIKIIKGTLILFFYILNKIFHSKQLNEFASDIITGESRVIKITLKKYLKIENLVFFDVGSNEGDYSKKLLSVFPKASIYAFEANKNTLKKVPDFMSKTSINFFNIGLASTVGTGIIYDYTNKIGSEHASIYKEVITDIHNDKNYSEIKFEKDTIDNFCNKHHIEKINFLKIDTEGSELDILKGASKMLSENKIDIIQFEFNSMNVISRVFLKDYYDLLKNWQIYRLEFFGLVPLPKYDTRNEIFKYQNFLAIRNKV